jgi:uncharacterized protein (TIGR00661 family)
MARIHYGLAGEGRGHAVRARTLLEELQHRHRFVVHAPGDAYEFLAPLYVGHPRIDVRCVPGLRWSYGKNRRVALVRSALLSVDYLMRLEGFVAALTRTLQDERSDLVITDFEPALSRAAIRARVPLVAIDHQAFLTTSDFEDLPMGLRRHAAFMGAFVERWAPEPTKRVVSSFYRPKLRAGVGGNVQQTGVLLRAAIRRAAPERAGFLVAYLRPGVPERVLDVLRRAPLEVRLYGRGAGRREGSLVRCRIDEARFLADLVACDGLVSTAGNQLIGEALFLGKPVLAAPELGNREQEINAWFLGRTPGGTATTFADLDDRELATFLARAGASAYTQTRDCYDGTPTALAAIESALEPDTSCSDIQGLERAPVSLPVPARVMTRALPRAAMARASTA